MAMEILMKKPKIQHPSAREIPNPKLQKGGAEDLLGIWSLGFLWILVLGIWSV
jgi:hypothetical protein